MDDQRASQIATKLITRSKTKTSKSHKKIVAMLNNLSKDKSGAPVKWKFNKKGIKQASQVGKKLLSAEVLKQSGKTDNLQKRRELTVSKNSKDSDTEVHKKKPGRSKLNKQDDNKESSENNISTEDSGAKEKDSDNLNSSLEDNNSTESFTKVKKKKVLAKDIKIKRLEILKRHIEKGKAKRGGRVKRIRDLHPPNTEKEMDGHSGIGINQDKLKMLKEQINSERKRGRGRGSHRRGRVKSMLITSHLDAVKSAGGMVTSASGESNVGDSMFKRGRKMKAKRGRRPWKNIISETRNDIPLDSMQVPCGDIVPRRSRGRPASRRGRGTRWTSLNRQTLSNNLLTKHSRQALVAGNLHYSDNLRDNIIDSENESIDSNLSSVSSKAKKRKIFTQYGITLGPAKPLRSQDSMKTRNIKESNGLPPVKRRKRTLSGEFDLLDEFSLRKQMRDKEDDASTVCSFDNSWADVTDSDCTDVATGNEDSDYENQKAIDLKDVHRKRGRKPKHFLDSLKSDSNKIDNKQLFRHRNTTGRLTIIGPGGIQFVKVKKLANSDIDSIDTYDKYSDSPQSFSHEEIISVQIVHDESVKENVVYPKPTNDFQKEKSPTIQTTEKSYSEMIKESRANDISQDGIAISQETILKSLQQVVAQPKPSVVSNVELTKTELDALPIKNDKEPASEIKDKSNDIPNDDEICNNSSSKEDKTEIIRMNSPDTIKSTEEDFTTETKEIIESKNSKVSDEMKLSAPSDSENVITEAEQPMKTEIEVTTPIEPDNDASSEIIKKVLEGLLAKICSVNELESPVSEPVQELGAQVQASVDVFEESTHSSQLKNDTTTPDVAKSNSIVEESGQQMAENINEVHVEVKKSTEHVSQSPSEPSIENIPDVPTTTNNTTVKQVSESLQSEDIIEQSIPDSALNTDQNLFTGTVNNEDSEPLLISQCNDTPEGVVSVKRKRKKETDIDSKSDSESQDSKNLSPEGKTETKRVFQLRKKASRSPLEILAMKHSLEDKQYLLEQNKRAIRREEKQRKMFQNKMLREKIEQLSPPKQSLENYSPPKQQEYSNVHLSPEHMEDMSADVYDVCKPCSVVMIDFVKYLKMNDNSEKTPGIEADLSITDDEVVQETETSVNKLQEDTVNDAVAPKEAEDVSQNSIENSVPTPPKRPAKARKQARSYNYPSKLTAEIVSSPEPTDSSSQSFTVPPLRLKIKQKEQIRRKRFKGHKWTVPRNKARKQMRSYRPILPKQQFEFETLGSGMETQAMPVRPAPRINENNVNTENAFRFKCSYGNCDFKSQRKVIMECHVYMHLDIPFKCSYCDEAFKSKNDAFNHVKRGHPEKEPKIVPGEMVNETQYFEEINTMPRSDGNVIQADIADFQNSSESVIISLRLPKNMNDSTTACYCCSYCECSSSNVQEISKHVEEKHRELIQYICSVCNKPVNRYGEGIARHFSNEHPDQPVAYKSLPDFYDVKKTIEKPSNGDKGNIFDRMSDLFSGKKNQDKGLKSVPEKTSAEADSTTVETDEEMVHSSGRPVASIDDHRPDGIEQLAQMYSQASSSADGKGTDEDQSFAQKTNEMADESGGNDMGLKIVDVCSLQGGSDFAKNVWGETPVVSKPTMMPVVPFNASMPVQVVPQQPALVQSSTIQQHLQTKRPILPMPSGKTDPAKMKETCQTYKCEKCNVHAPVLSSMVEHLRSSHREIPRLFLCPFCRLYEGATEPDIHKHIKQFHPSPDTRSPPVALSSDAKQHLRTIEVAIGDTPKVNGKYLIERDIYKCLKCKRHMPSLEYIYEHLEKEHNEVFVYVCPDCKRFRDKEEEIVFNHIKTVHNKNTDNIILSLAIEENLFTRVMCLTKDKASQNKGQLQKQVPPTLTTASNTVRQPPKGIQTSSEVRQRLSVYQNRPIQPFQPPVQALPVHSMNQSMSALPVHQPIQALPAHSASQSVPSHSIHHMQALPVYSMHQPMQPVFPGMIPNQQIRMPAPLPTSLPEPQKPPPQTSAPPAPPVNKASTRKSYRPVHIPQNSSHSPHTIQHLPNDGGKKTTTPPPLMRGPPPLIRFQGNSSQSSVQQTASSPANVRSTNFSMTEKVQRLHPQGQSLSSAVSPPPQGRPVLKVPNFHRTASSPGHSDGGRSDRAPLDLSRNSTPNSQHDNTEEMEDISPESFQIFNLQPQLRPQSRPSIPFSQMQNVSKPGGFNPSAYTRPNMYNPMAYRSPPPYQQHHGPYAQNPLPMQVDQRPLKCPYCPNQVPLSLDEVAPHIHRYHPGQKVQFVKKD